MSNKLNSIMLKIRNSLDSQQNINNYGIVTDAVSELEVFPMTMGQLRDSRIGQLLQLIRRKVDPSLQKRIRLVIKSWQCLLEPDCSTSTVVPLKQHGSNNHTQFDSGSGSKDTTVPQPVKVAATNGSNGNGLPVSRVPTVFLQHSPSSSCHSNHSASGVNLVKSASTNVLTTAAVMRVPTSLSSASASNSPFQNARKRVHGDNELPEKPRESARILVSRSPVQSKVMTPNRGARLPHPHGNNHTPIINGRNLLASSGDENSMSPTLFSGRNMRLPSDAAATRPPTTQSAVANSATFPADVDTHSLASDSSVHTPNSRSRGATTTSLANPRLAKVKSTAELVQAAGDCIDSATADRILTNRVTKEPDVLCPSVPPHLSKVRTPARANVSGPVRRTGQVVVGQPTTAVSSPNFEGVPSVSSMTAAKSEMMAKFLASTALHHQEIVQARQQGGQSRTSAVSDEPVAPTVALAEADKSGTQRVPTMVDTDEVSDALLRSTGIDDKYKLKDRGKKDKKKKRKHRAYQAGDSDDEQQTAVGDALAATADYHHRRKKRRNNMPPITNHMDDWPILPDIPEYIDWHNLSPQENVVENGDVATVKQGTSHNAEDHMDLLSGNFLGKNCLRDDDGNLRPLTELYSVSTGDRFLHILPWVDVIGHQRNFFPPTALDDIEKLIDLPDPW